MDNKFGTRLLESEEQVFEQNAWDNVNWTDEQRQRAIDIVNVQRLKPVPEDMREKYKREAAEYWNTFYEHNKQNFFKERHWFRLEFPELFSRQSSSTADENGSRDVYRIFEVGCGTGSSVFPILNSFQEAGDNDVMIYACDFSQVAVDLVRSNPAYDTAKCKAFQFDLTSIEDSVDLPEDGSLDIILMVFVLSAITPAKMPMVLQRLYRLLKPGGLLCFRDYGRHDLAQLRFKSGRLLDDNFYVRGDGTMVYFFELDEMARLATDAGFDVELNTCDQRLLVNRSKKLTMYRRWIQGKYRKPCITAPNADR